MDLLLHPLAAESATGVSGSFDNGGLIVAGLFVNVTAVSGTLPTLIVKVQHSPDGTTWYDVPNLTTASLGGLATVSIMLSTLTPLADHVRCIWTIGGVLPNFTFTADLAVISR